MNMNDALKQNKNNDKPNEKIGVFATRIIELLEKNSMAKNLKSVDIDEEKKTLVFNFKY